MFFRKKNPEIIVYDGFIAQKDITIIMNFLKNNEFLKSKESQIGRNNFEFFTNNNRVTELIYKSVKKKFKLIQKPDILEFYYYTRGNFSSAHTDECTKFLPKVFSNYTAVIYLNDDFIGGETYFTTKEKTIVPKIGRLLMFQHHLMHQGNEVELGTKYIFRANWKIKIN